MSSQESRQEESTDTDEPSVIHSNHTGFVCQHCEFRADRRTDFGTFGKAMLCPECGSARVEHEFADNQDGEIPESFESLASTCENCGDDVDPERLIEGECPGCHYRPMADGGELPTCPNCGEPVLHETTTGPDAADVTRSCGCSGPLRADGAELTGTFILAAESGRPLTWHHSVEFDGRIHTTACGREISCAQVREVVMDATEDVWRRECDDEERCAACGAESIAERELVADGGTAWTALTGFKRDCLEAIRRLEGDDETTYVYGLAIKDELERVYGEEVNHGRLYPNLDDLVDAGLVEKSELDKRTNQYQLTSEAEAMLEQRARLLADACGMQQPVADGGDA